MRAGGAVIGFVGLLVLGGCGSVVIDEDDDAETSSAGPSTAAGFGSGGAPASGTGTGAGDASSTGSESGSGGATTTGGGAGEPTLAWSETSTREVTAFGGVGDFAALAWPGLTKVPLLISHLEGEDHRLRKYGLEDVVSAWEGTPSLEDRSDDGMWGDWTARESVVAAPIVGTAYDGSPTPGWRVVLNKPGRADKTRPDEVHFRELLHDGPRPGSPGAERPLERAMAAVAVDDTWFSAHVVGDEALSVETRLEVDGPLLAVVSDVACADRRIPVAGLGLDGRFAIAHAAGGSPCGAAPQPPDTAEVVFFGSDGALTGRSETVPMSAPVAEIQVAHGSGSLWLAARLEGEGGLELARLSLGGAVLSRARLAMAGDRSYALATWGDELVVVDGGRDDDAESRLRVRVLDVDGAVVLTSPSLPPTGRTITTVAAVGSLDGDAVLIAFSDHEENGVRTRYGVVRADLVGER